jgi:hypothetical protein
MVRLIAFLLLVGAHVLLPGWAQAECHHVEGVASDGDGSVHARNADGTGDPNLPDEARGEVVYLDALMRLMTATGFHDKSRARRDEIIAIYDSCGVAVPGKYLQ